LSGAQQAISRTTTRGARSAVFQGRAIAPFSKSHCATSFACRTIDDRRKGTGFFQTPSGFALPLINCKCRGRNSCFLERTRRVQVGVLISQTQTQGSRPASPRRWENARRSFAQSWHVLVLGSVSCFEFDVRPVSHTVLVYEYKTDITISDGLYVEACCQHHSYLCIASMRDADDSAFPSTATFIN
jgi:hypothetical protein